MLLLQEFIQTTFNYKIVRQLKISRCRRCYKLYKYISMKQININSKNGKWSKSKICPKCTKPKNKAHAKRLEDIHGNL